MIDYYVALTIVLRLGTLFLLLGYVVPRQIKEVRRIKDQFTPLRWMVLAMIIFFILASSPVLIYQGVTLKAPHSSFQDISSLFNGLSSVAVGVVLYLIYNYKYEE